MNPRILVLGGTGFIGRHLVTACRAREIDVLATSRDERLGFLKLDPLDLDALRWRLEDARPSAVVNCTGIACGTDAELIAANVAVVSNLLKAIPDGTQLVQIGSAAEYGIVETGVPIATDAPERPANAYGIAKLAATRQVVQARARGAQAVVLRLFNPLGPDSPDSSLPGRVVARLRAALERREDSIRFGSLDASRDFVDIRDAVQALIAAATLETPPPILNLGSGAATLTRDLVGMLAEIAGFDGRILEDGVGSPRAGQIDWQSADISRTVSSLGWAPRYALRESLEWVWQAGA